MSLPKYSVLMSIYVKEKPEYFREALESMINQTVKPDEILIVEDGPLTESLYAVLDEYKAKYPQILHSIRNEKNLGLGLALNAGLKECRNELVARMDTDDISVPNRCEKQLEAFVEKPNLDIVGGNITEFIDSIDNKVGVRVVPQTNLEIREYLKKRCPLNHVTVMFKKSSIQKVGGYVDWFWNEDYYLWIRMYLADMIFANVPETLVNVRVGKEMYQRRGGKKYFLSEYGLQKLMLKKKIISFFTFIDNVIKRFFVQLLLPNKVRGWIFKKFARRPE
ncbi:MAG: glycosyltransferase [Fibrobacter sp.]|nr:glycosyltransferase [Fibrobacter sp.]